MPTHAIVNDGNPDITVAVYQHKTILTDAEIKALPSTYITLLPAPGVGKMLVLHQSCFQFKFLAGGYANADANHYLSIVYGDFDTGASTIVKLFTQGLDNRAVFVVPVVTVIGADLTTIPSSIDAMGNAPLKLFASNNLGDFTGGNAANTLEVTVYYSIVDL